MKTQERTRNITTQLVELPDLPDLDSQGPTLFDGHLSLIRSVKVKLEARVGGATLTVGELSALKDGSVIQLDRAAGAPIDILLEGHVIARGVLVAVDDEFGVRITETVQAVK
jgi:flagellar motor switch protein FliN